MSHKVLKKDFIALKHLGRGNYGQVDLVVKLRGVDKGHEYALKRIEKGRIMHSSSLKRGILTERDILIKLRDHPSFPGLVYAFQTRTCLYLVMEPIYGCELFDFMNIFGTFHQDLTLFYVNQIVLMLEYLHARGIVFRDLKPENMIVMKHNGYIRLVDFGHARSGIYSHSQKMTTCCGTRAYRSPEMINFKRGYTRACDWWALGIIMYDMLFGILPFDHEDDKITTKLILEAPLRFPTPLGLEIDDSTKEIIRLFLNREYQSRLGAGPDDALEVQRHPYFSSYDWERLRSRQLPFPHNEPLLVLMEKVPHVDDTIYEGNFEKTYEHFDGFDFTSPEMIEEDEIRESDSSDADGKTTARSSESSSSNESDPFEILMFGNHKSSRHSL
ncbi:unnamed protein product [Bursaphelenchus xylophilus]|uniref:(pine wood nematode) hypothetical protein n=1 Tax=Bursaphelenchus xylophilus TaxID=6326 RepID=A0A1I7RHH3_BURXY|nr:unnamed protein product [Bursaphelenchus xylophilus]CAG9115756.1 unnamed protein product [Bursaphelenchus xylophilus]